MTLFLFSKIKTVSEVKTKLASMEPTIASLFKMSNLKQTGVSFLAEEASRKRMRSWSLFKQKWRKLKQIISITEYHQKEILMN